MSVIIPNLNGAETLGLQLEALVSQSYEAPYEIVIADNGSSDSSLDIAAGFESRLDLRVVDASKRRGINHARNEGAKWSRGEFLIFCDNDDVVSKGWLAAMVECADHFDIVGGWEEHELLNDSSTWAYAPYKISTTRPPSWAEPAPTAFGFLPFAIGCSFGIWADVLSALGGWNEDYVIGCDEIELCWRAGLSGFRIGLAPDAVVHYRWREGFRPMFDQVVKWGMEEVHLYRDFKDAGMPRDRTADVLRDWLWIALHLVNFVRSPAHKGALIRRLAKRWGHIRGALRYRVIYP